jgi:hypothetical protein
MAKIKIRFIHVVYCLAIILADVFIYLVLGLLQMDYDDSYDSSKGEYWSLASMNNRQLIYYFALHLWNILNILGLILMLRKLYKRIKSTS